MSIKKVTKVYCSNFESSRFFVAILFAHSIFFKHGLSHEHFPTLFELLKKRYDPRRLWNDVHTWVRIFRDGICLVDTSSKTSRRRKRAREPAMVTIVSILAIITCIWTCKNIETVHIDRQNQWAIRYIHVYKCIWMFIQIWIHFHYFKNSVKTPRFWK